MRVICSLKKKFLLARFSFEKLGYGRFLKNFLALSVSVVRL
jgi:hypothetical protein